MSETIEHVKGEVSFSAIYRARSAFALFMRDMFDVSNLNISPSLGGMFTALWLKRRAIGLAIAVCGLVGYIAAAVQPPEYVATMVLIPNIENQLNMGSSTGTIGVLSNLVSGSPLQKPERVTLFQQFMAVITSPPAAEQLERQGHYLQHFYPDRWDKKLQHWKPITPSLFGTIKGFLKSALRLPNRPHPDTEELSRILQKRLEISADEKTSIFTFTFADEDRQFAADFLKAVYNCGETLLLQQARAIAHARVRQTERELADTSVESSRKTLTDVLTVFHAREVEANVGSPYAAQIVYGPVSTDYPARPDTLLYILAGLFFGLFLSCFYFMSASLFACNARNANVPEVVERGGEECQRLHWPAPSE